jgi:hypothetical protein
LSVPTVAPGDSAPRATLEDLPPAVARRDEVRRAFDIFAWFSDDFLVQDPENPRFFGDMRYALPPQSMRPLWGLLAPAENMRTRPYQTGASRDRDDVMGHTWRALWGHDEAYIPLPALLATMRAEP